MKRMSMDRDGVAAVLFVPDGDGPAPGVLLLGGSEGGVHERDAQVLSAAGFTVLALGYFGMPGLPPSLIEIPVEYLARGLDVLAAQPGTGEQFGVTGGSRGGEAALLLAAHDQRVSAVVSVAGSGILTQGIDFRLGSLPAILGTPTVAWTRDGLALPYLPSILPDELTRLIAEGAPVPLSLSFPPIPDDPAELARVSIPVERSRAAVLMICGSDDRSWPSGAYSRVALDRLRSANRHAELQILPGVGHPIAGPPGRPFTSTTSPGPGVLFEMGGSAAANTAARAHTWTRTVDWFRTHLPG